MNPEAFVDVVKLVVVKSMTEGVKENLESVPGRDPQEKHLKMSAYYNSLSEADKHLVNMIIQESVHAAVFQFLCVLDGVVAIEDANKGKLTLRYTNTGKDILLNDPEQEYLHDLFNTI